MQQMRGAFGEWFHFHEHFFVLDCRSALDKDMKSLRAALAASHERLRKTAPQVPAVCVELLKTIPKLRATHRDEPIVSVSELLGELSSTYAEELAGVLSGVMMSICRYAVCV
jgi:hypothetical protein